MNRKSTTQTLAFALFAIWLTACCNNREQPQQRAAAAIEGVGTPEVTSLQPIPVGATHCRIGHEYKEIAPGVWVTSRLVWFVREAKADEFASLQGNNFEIVENYSNGRFVSPPFVIDVPDQFNNKVQNGIIEVAYTNDSGQAGQTDFDATLTMQKFGNAELWGQGRATPRGGTASTGTITLFLSPDAQVCKHRKLIKPPHTCRRVLIEYFDDNDTIAKADLPQTSGTGQNIFPIADDVCQKAGKGEETSDGEGHEGPP